jgi:hypothetical protein
MAPSVSGDRLKSRRWTPAHDLALAGGLLLAVQLAVLRAWLGSGPHAITRYRVHHGTPWWAAVAFQAAAVGMAVWVLVFVVRGCLRQRRLTIDAKICLAGLLTAWLDPFTNFMQPLFMYSSNFVNLNSWGAHYPLVINPDAGRLPWPILFLGCMYAFGLLAFAVIMNAIVRMIVRRFPALTRVQVLMVTLGLGVLFDLALEIPMFRLRLWAYPGAPNTLALWSRSSYKYSLWEIIPAGIAFASVAAVRFFKDDANRTVTERGLERHHRSVRTALSVLALIGLFNTVWLASTAFQAGVGLYAAPYPKLPAYIINGMCDPPGATGTAYGPCPGSPGYRLPLRHLP